MDELWEALYLTTSEVEKLLDHVESHAAHPWIHPMLATAAYTGARRGELLRMRIGDLDLAAGVTTIRERKRTHGRRTTRRVPLATALAAYTSGTAHVNGHDDAGSIQVGNLTDLVVLDRDVFAAPAEEICEARVERTYVGGELVHASA